MNAVVAFLNKSVALHTKVAQEIGLETFSLPQPTLTRWFSIALTLSKLSKLKVPIKSAVSKDEDKTYLKNSRGFSKFKGIIFEDQFWESISSFSFVMKPFVFAQALSEMRNVTSGLVLASWMWLMLLIDQSPRLAPSTKHQMKEKFDSRINNYIESFHWAASMLSVAV